MVKNGTQIPPIKNAGNVQIAPAAIDSPIEPTVLVKSFFKNGSFHNFDKCHSNYCCRKKSLTVIPAFNPRYAFAAPRTTANINPMIKARMVNSAIEVSGETKGNEAFGLSHKLLLNYVREIVVFSVIRILVSKRMDKYKQLLLAHQPV